MQPYWHEQIVLIPTSLPADKGRTVQPANKGKEGSLEYKVYREAKVCGA